MQTIEFFNMTQAKYEIMQQRDALMLEQDDLKVHHYRTPGMVLTEKDKKFDALQAKIDALNKQLGY